MDKFQFKIELERIKKLTKVTELKKVMSVYFNKANNSFKYTNNDVYFKLSNIERIQDSVYANALAKTAKERYDSLGFDESSLPAYTRYNWHVDVQMSLEEAFDWVKSNQKKDT